MQTPEYYLPIMPYLIVDKVKDFVEFMKNVFNAEEKIMVAREDGTLMHGELSIGKAIIMFTDLTGHYKPFPARMFLLVENVDEVYHLALDKGAISLQEPDDRDYGRSAGFQDRFGNHWWLTKPQLS